jgi:cyanophycinase
MSVADAGPLIAIGGHEDRTGRRQILSLVASHLGGQPLALITAASRRPEAYIDVYTVAFAELGVVVRPVQLGREALRSCGGVFFTGGKQGLLMQHLRATGLDDELRRMWAGGCLIAGTSAGASVLARQMVGRDSARSGEGLGLLTDVIIDQHFTERRRERRLSAAVSRHPALLGVGIDEDTAVEFRGGAGTVVGSGTVTLLRASAPARVLADGDAMPSPLGTLG